MINTILLKGGISVIAKEILEIISKPWCSNQDIMKIANVSATTASKIKQEIEKEFRKKNQINICQHTVFLRKKLLNILI